ncbi:TTU family subclass B1 metallo-beta-lactamase [Teredinibacter turnerae]|uniref:TTU family subclass B1 metallo-beta-lactamase n=1 Tax=Teredinibacter turnerae TaxID=2426 RepID=UPI00037D17C8|nr:TTU family subclass B1 metallo-beta-lactamase [Teredinibacter turnerae]
MRVFLVIFILFIAGGVYAGEELPSLSVEQIEKDVFLHRSYSQVNGFGLVSSNGLVVVENKKAFIVDTPWSEKDTINLVQWIEDRNLVLIGSISTHSHEDRTAGIKWLNAHSIPTYASALTNELLKKDNKEVATKSFEGAELMLADGLIEAFYPGGGHTIDNIVVWLPKSQILFGGCLVRSVDSTGLGYVGEADIKSWSSSVENVLSKYPEIKKVVPGHGKIGGLSLLTHTKMLAISALPKLSN